MEQPIQILERKEQLLQKKTIPLMKILLKYHSQDEATWEREERWEKTTLISSIIRNNHKFGDQIFVKGGGCNNPKNLK